jgi:hypothetical protein
MVRKFDLYTPTQYRKSMSLMGGILAPLVLTDDDVFYNVDNYIPTNESVYLIILCRRWSLSSDKIRIISTYKGRISEVSSTYKDYYKIKLNIDTELCMSHILLIIDGKTMGYEWVYENLMNILLRGPIYKPESSWIDAIILDDLEVNYTTRTKSIYIRVEHGKLSTLKDSIITLSLGLV